MSTFLLQVYSLSVRDLVHFFRQRSRVVGAIGQPIVLWVFLDAGFRHSVGAAEGGMRYGAYLFPGVIVLIALFSAIFSTISVIEDRKSGFLQGVLAAPVPGAAIVLAKMVAGTALAFAQAIIFMGLLPLAGVSITAEGAALSALALAFIGMTLTNVGFIISWRMTSTQGFHAIMNLLLIPAWVLSGAFFPPEGAAGWLQWIIRLNPLYYISALFREAFWFGMPHASGAPGAAVALAVSVLAFCVLTAVSLRVVRVR